MLGRGGGEGNTDLEARGTNFAVNMVPDQFLGQTLQALLVLQAANKRADSRQHGHGVGTPHPRGLHDVVRHASEVLEVLLPDLRERLEQPARA